MELILAVLITPILVLVYLVIFGSKECYCCGHRLNEKRRPIHVKGKRLCDDCWVTGKYDN